MADDPFPDDPEGRRGAEDFLRPAADTLAAGIPGAELVIFEGCGHSPQEDDPAAWQAAVLAHLSRA